MMNISYIGLKVNNDHTMYYIIHLEKLGDMFFMGEIFNCTCNRVG